MSGDLHPTERLGLLTHWRESSESGANLDQHSSVSQACADWGTQLVALAYQPSTLCKAGSAHSESVGLGLRVPEGTLVSI